MSATESGYTSTEETLPKRSSHKSARPQSLVPPYLATLLPAYLFPLTDANAGLQDHGGQLRGPAK